MACCPPGSWPQLEKEHTGKGRFIDIGGGLEAYQVGTGSKGVLFVTDIFGPREGGGRNQLIADQLAALGLYVLAPDYFKHDYAEWPAGSPMPTGSKGSDLMEWLQKYTWKEKVGKQTETAMAFLASEGVTDVAGLGFCWGVGPVLELALAGNVKCFASAHPSMNLLGVAAGHTEAEFKAIKVPMLMLPAIEEPASVKPGGDFIEAVKANGVESLSVDFTNQHHGFFGRAPLDDPQNAKDVEECFNLVARFFTKHLSLSGSPSNL